jgi:uncharacterized phage-associated protein
MDIVNKFYEPLEIVDWFLAYGIQEGRRMSPLRVQMLLYYTQQHALNGKLGPVFLEKFEYANGVPYVKSVLEKFQEDGLGEEDEITEFNIDIQWDYYGDFQELLLVMFSIYCQ